MPNSTIVLLAGLLLLGGSTVLADEACLDCHSDLVEGAAQHGALSMGCDACHSALDASDVPHQITGGVRHGLGSEPPTLCFDCHDKEGFEGRVVHAPVAAGECSGCHAAHSSANSGLLLEAPAVLCGSCHAGYANGRHVVAEEGYGSRHPTTGKPDPAHPGRDLSCVSCHEPHASRVGSLLPSSSSGHRELCLTCHERIMVRP